MSRTHLLLILKVDTSSEAHGALALDLLPAVQLLQSDLVLFTERFRGHSRQLFGHACAMDARARERNNLQQ